MASVVYGDYFCSGNGPPGLCDHSRNVLLLVIEGDDKGKVGLHGLFDLQECGETGKHFWKESRTDDFPDVISRSGNQPSVENRQRDRGQNIRRIVVSSIDAAETGEGNEDPGPAKGGSPDQAGGHGGCCGVGDVGGGEGATMQDIPLRDT